MGRDNRNLMREKMTMISCFAVLALLIGSVFHPSLVSGEPPFQDVPLPKTLTLCGESMPLDNPAVGEILERELTILAWDHGQVFMWIKRAGRFFPPIERKLREAGMPDDIKYLAVAESSLLSGIRSVAGAAGPWQFIPQTGANHGLRTDRFMDERLDFERSTEAAIKYLQNLMEMFGSWTLALAAYNCGEVRLKKEIEDQKVKDYYRLDLPNETERFIYRIAAVKLILENPEQYGYLIDKERIYKPILSDVVAVSLQTFVPVIDIAFALGTDYKTIKELNPQITGSYLPHGSYTLRVPPGLAPKAAEFLGQQLRITSQNNSEEVAEGVKPLIADRQADPQADPQDSRPRIKETPDKYYVVRPGDTLSLISSRKKIPVDVLKRINGIQGSRITVGQKLRLAS